MTKPVAIVTRKCGPKELLKRVNLLKMDSVHGPISGIIDSDTENNTITYSISGTDASSISVNSSSGVLTFNSAPDYETKTSYSITTEASDGENNISRSVGIFIVNVNDVAPTFTSSSTFAVNENQIQPAGYMLKHQDLPGWLYLQFVQKKSQLKSFSLLPYQRKFLQYY